MRRKDPAGHSAGYGLSIVGRLWDRRPEDRDLTVVVAAGQSGYTDVQEAGVADDRQVREPAFDMVTDPAGMPAARAVGIDGHRVAEQVGDVFGVGGIVDGQAQLARSVFQHTGDVVQGVRTIDLRFTQAEKVQIGAVENENDRGHGRALARAGPRHQRL